MATAGLGASERDCVRILGVSIDCVTMDQTLARFETYLSSDRSHLVVTADASALVIAHSDSDFRNLIHSADLVTPDGIGVLWAAKRRGGGLQERVSGVDIVERLCALSADKGYRIFLLGASPGVSRLAAEKLRLKFPGCNIVGDRDGYFPAESDEVVAREIAAARPDILLVGMGMPRQERFIRATSQIIGAKVAMGVGGSFDVFSGKKKRAPVIFRRLKLEWLWRQVLNRPQTSKLGMLPKFVMLILREKR